MGFAFATCSTKKLEDDDFALPFSKHKFLMRSKKALFVTNESPFEKAYIGQAARSRSRSPFVAISGHGDYYTQASDLTLSARTILHFDLNSLPMVAPPCDNDPGKIDELEPS